MISFVTEQLIASSFVRPQDVTSNFFKNFDLWTPLMKDFISSFLKSFRNKYTLANSFLVSNNFDKEINASRPKFYHDKQSSCVVSGTDSKSFAKAASGSAEIWIEICVSLLSRKPLKNNSKFSRSKLRRYSDTFFRLEAGYDEKNDRRAWLGTSNPR